MKFLITATCSFAKGPIDNYPFLGNYGYDLEEFPVVRKSRIKDENGNLIWQERHETVSKPVIHIYSLEELMELMNRVGEPIIISDDSCNDLKLPEIEIYDGYRE